jgi:hypothetical protein
MEKKMSLAVIISIVTTFSALGQPRTNYVASVERMKTADCLIIKQSIDKHHTVDCVRETK